MHNDDKHNEPAAAVTRLPVDSLAINRRRAHAPDCALQAGM